MCIELDFRHGLTDSGLTDAKDGQMALILARGNEKVVVHLSVPSVDALWLLLTRKLARHHGTVGNGGSTRPRE
jgi:hypothetical protein